MTFEWLRTICNEKIQHVVFVGIVVQRRTIIPPLPMRANVDTYRFLFGEE